MIENKGCEDGEEKQRKTCEGRLAGHCFLFLSLLSASEGGSAAAGQPPSTVTCFCVK